MEILRGFLRRRKSFKYTFRDMGEKLGCSRQNYQQFESKGSAGLTKLLAICEVLELELMVIPKNKGDKVKEELK